MVQWWHRHSVQYFGAAVKPFREVSTCAVIHDQICESTAAPRHTEVSERLRCSWPGCDSPEPCLKAQPGCSDYEP